MGRGPMVRLTKGWGSLRELIRCGRLVDMGEQPSFKPLPTERKSEKPTSAPPSRLRVDKSPFPSLQISMTKAEREKMERELEKHRRTPEQLGIANDAWFDCGPGEVTP
jgi:hypothetical protein